MAAAVMEGGVVAMKAYSTSSVSSLPLQGGAVCSSSPLRFRSYGSTSSSRAVLPTSRGLKLSFGGRRLPAAVVVRASQLKGVVCEASDTAVGAARSEPGICGVVCDEDFRNLVLNSDVPVLVDFWAPWCGPCRMIAPIIDELARQYAGKLRCLKLNTDESPYTATEYGIRSIPTVMIFKGGEKKDTVIGAVPMSTLTATIEKYLG